MNVNKTFSEILTECGGVEEMKKAFDEFIKCETEIRVGSTVKVMNWGLNFSMNHSWFTNNSIPRDLCLRYAYGHDMLGQDAYSEDTIFKVLRIYNEKALITPLVGYDMSPCYLVGVDALEIVKAQRKENR